MAESKSNSLATNLDEIIKQASLTSKAEGAIRLATVFATCMASIRGGGGNYNSYDGTTGYALAIKIPYSVYVAVCKDLSKIIEEARFKINQIAQGYVPDEFVESISFCIRNDDPSWRENSGLLNLSDDVPVAEDAQARIWTEDGTIRVFVSHSDEDRAIAKDFYDLLNSLGLTAFVAHKSIINLTMWPDELTNALKSMHVCVALLTQHFHSSYWADQEVGWAYARGVRVFPVNLGCGAYGFMSTTQANPIKIEDAARMVFHELYGHESWIDALFKAIERCSHRDLANFLWAELQRVNELSTQQASNLIIAVNSNSWIAENDSFCGAQHDGSPLINYLNKSSDQKYMFGEGKWYKEMNEKYHSRNEAIPF